MASGDAQIRLSVIDRLIDEEPQNDREGRPRRMASVEELKRLVRRDLEWLLGTRWTTGGTEQGQERTVLEYGLPDFSSRSPSNHRVKREIAREIRDAVEAHEPRLRGVEVSVAEDPTTPGQIKATIQGTLVAERLREPVSFPFEIRLR
jgi:type VI secretion system protein ImpF